MTLVANWRPAPAGAIALSDAELAKIGLMVVCEANAKSMAAMALKVVERSTYEAWIRLDRQQFSQIMKRLIEACRGVDRELEERVAKLESARVGAHELRHIIVHAIWGQGPGPDCVPTAYDYGRKRELGPDDIDKALDGCAELKRAAHWAVYRLAELVENGVFPEGSAGVAGMGVRTSNRLVRL